MKFFVLFLCGLGLQLASFQAAGFQGAGFQGAGFQAAGLQAADVQAVEAYDASWLNGEHLEEAEGLHHKAEKIDYADCGMKGSKLIEAILYRRVKTVALMLRAGCDANTRLNEGSTALHQAVTDSMVERKKPRRGESRWVIRPPSLAIVLLLLAAGADVHARDGLGITPFYAAAQPMAFILPASLDAPAESRGLSVDPSHRGDNKQERRAAHRLLILLKVLIAAGADINATDTLYGRTALTAAVMGLGDYHIRVLLKLGVDATLTDADGDTALDKARKQGHTKAVRWIEKHMAKKGDGHEQA